MSDGMTFNLTFAKMADFWLISVGNITLGVILEFENKFIFSSNIPDIVPDVHDLTTYADAKLHIKTSVAAFYNEFTA